MVRHKWAKGRETIFRTTFYPKQLHSHIRLHLLSHTMSSKGRKDKAEQPKLFSAVETNSKLLDLLEITITHDRKAIFIQSLLKVLPTAFSRFDKPPVDLFNIFTGWFGKHDQSETLYPGISAALHHRKTFYLDRRKVKRDFISNICFDWTAEVKNSSFSKVNLLYGDVKRS